MDLIVLANGPFAVPSLKALFTSEHRVVAVVCRPPQGRKAKPGPVQQEAQSLGLDVWLPPTANDDVVESKIADSAAQLLVVCDYGEILRPSLLASTPLGAINLHGSLLPKYRGAAPVQWAILRGEKETGNTIFQLTPGLDAGPILAQQQCPIDDDDTAETLEKRLAEMGAELLLQVVDQIEKQTIQPLPQQDSSATKARRLRKQDGEIDWTRSATRIERQIRAMQPWPKAFTFWERLGRDPLRMIVRKARVLEGEAPPILRAGDTGDVVVVGKQTGQAGESGHQPPPGMVLEAGPRLLVAAGDGILEIVTLQPAGKRAMQIDEFLRGYPIRPGHRLFSPEA